MQRINAPDGTSWEVGVSWPGRYLQDPGGVVGRRLRSTSRRRTERSESGRPSRWWDVLDFTPDVESVGWLVALIAIIAVLVIAGPWVVALLLGAIEVVALVVAAVAVFAGRTLLRRPWPVVARSGAGDEYVWRVVGWRASREAARRFALAIAWGQRPAQLEPARLVRG